jgi:hypothetical protein
MLRAVDEFQGLLVLAAGDGVVGLLGGDAVPDRTDVLAQQAADALFFFHVGLAFSGVELLYIRIREGGGLEGEGRLAA